MSATSFESQLFRVHREPLVYILPSIPLSAFISCLIVAMSFCRRSSDTQSFIAFGSTFWVTEPAAPTAEPVFPLVAEPWRPWIIERNPLNIGQPENK